MKEHSFHNQEFVTLDVEALIIVVAGGEIGMTFKVKNSCSWSWGDKTAF